jgi:radical SAM protein with 4Fe4S-binding SPASM domain
MNARTSVPLPRFVQIEPVGECNLRCTMCAVSFRDDAPADGSPAYLSFDNFKRLLDGFGEIDELHLQGLGEPLMNPDFFRMVAYARSKGIDVSTNSNLTLLTEVRAQACVQSGLSTLHISIDGATAEVYEGIRHGASFQKVLRNLDRIVAAKKALRSSTPALRIVMVLMRANLPQLAQIVRLAHAHGVFEIFVQHLSHDFGESQLPAPYIPMRDFYSAQTLLNEDPHLINECFESARACAAELGVHLRLPALEAPHSSGSYGCDWPWRGAYLTYRGDALPCCMVGTADRFNLGNMLAEGIKPVWEGPAYQKLRHALASAEPPEICRSCSIYRQTF